MENKKAFWIQQENDSIFTWHHIPNSSTKNLAIIIIGPIGPEYMPCHRSIKLLSETLAGSGFHAFRYDPIGMGNSSGVLDDNNIWDKWSKTPFTISNHIKNYLGITEISIICLRSGCFTISNLLRKIPVRNLILWHPITQGTNFIRAIQLIDSVLYEESSVSETLEGGGYPFNKYLQNNLKKIDLKSFEYNNLNNILIINDKDKNTNKLLNEIISSCENINSKMLFLEGLDDMIKQVTLSKIPFSNIDKINKWFLSLESKPGINNTDSFPQNLIYKNDIFSEDIFRISMPKHMFGILTLPLKHDIKKLLIFVNTGAAHHAGPNRIHVEAARTLAKSGITTLRIDLSNLGDSSISYETDPPNEYPETAADEINIIIDSISKTYPDKQILLCGISAGAHNIFHAALKSKDTRINKLILINPDSFYYENDARDTSNKDTNEHNQAYYQKQVYNIRKWWSLLRNPSKILRIFKFILIQLYNNIMRFLFILKKTTPNRFEADINLLCKKNIDINLIYSEGEASYLILRNNANSALKKCEKLRLFSHFKIKKSDHTFSSLNSRQSLYKTIKNCIDKLPLK